MVNEDTFLEFVDVVWLPIAIAMVDDPAQDLKEAGCRVVQF